MDERLLQKYEELRENRAKFCRDHGVPQKMVMIEAKNLVLNGRTSSNFTTKKTKGWSDTEYYCALSVLKYMFDEIYMLSPEKIDALWQYEESYGTYKFLEATVTKTLIDKILSESLNRRKACEILKDCLLNEKKFILKSLYPDYYSATYNNTYDIFNDVINADGITLRDLKTNGKPRSKASHNKTYSMGNIVDSILMEAFEANFSAREKIIDYKDKLLFLAQYKKNHINQLPFFKILKSRTCYASALDFYYLNSSEELQTKYFTTYFNLRNQYQKNDICTTFFQAYDNNKETCGLE